MDLVDKMLMFGNDVVNALNAANVKPSGDSTCALMIIVGDPEAEDQMPAGCSVNFDRETGKWSSLEMAEVGRVDLDG